VPQNFPDSLCNSKKLVFVHGYSVSETEARYWNAEMFKRMYQSGSRARYYAVTWFGNDSQQNWLGGRTPDYHVNVVHALDSAGAFANVLNNWIGGDITLAAHSLGNMLSSAAITKHGANVSKFFMLDAAVPMEAYDGNTGKSLDMVPNIWGQYPEWLWCSEWHTNFPAGDGRRQMTWRDLFSAGAGNAYNFYSSGEDVLKAHPHATDPGLWCYFSGEYSWCLQEKRKGQNWISVIGGETYGGWGLNVYYIMNGTMPMDAEETKSEPFFHTGRPELADLYVPLNTNQVDVGSQFAVNNLNFLLASFVPSRTLPMGANNVQALNSPTEIKNFNMQTPEFQTGWPGERDDNDWLHSDLREVAYPFVRKLFETFKTLGGLNQQ
jgi:pimeloyl-ACP methyl ester carboxylesterase